MKTLDDLVIGRNGLWFTPEEASKAFHHSDFLFMYDSGGSAMEPKEVGMRFLDAVISKEQFQQRAKELGFINGYRWGVEYKTNGKRPDLPDDVCAYGHGGRYVSFVSAPITGIDWHRTEKFVICDARYRPADTSYLEKLIHKESDVITWNVPEPYFKVTVSGVGAGGTLGKVDSSADWYDYDNEKALRLPPVGEKVQLKHKQTEQGIAEFISYRDGEVVWWNVDGRRFQYDKARHYEFKPLDHGRKAERKRFIDSGCNITDNLRGVFTSDNAAHDALCALYDAGFRLPE